MGLSNGREATAKLNTHAPRLQATCRTEICVLLALLDVLTLATTTGHYRGSKYMAGSIGVDAPLPGL